MKSRDSRVKALAALLCGMLLSGCDSDEDAADLSDRFSIAADNITSLRLATPAGVDVVETGRSITLTFTSEDGMVSYASQASWSSSDTSIATVNGNGVVTGVADGTVAISAGFGPFTESVDVRVSSAELTAIEISAVELVNECDSVQLSANGRYGEDNDSVRPLSEGVVWTASKNPSIGVFSEATEGLFRTNSAGTTNITAARGAITSQSIAVVVKDNLESINISPAAPVVTTSSSAQFDAIAVYSDTDESRVITDNVNWEKIDSPNIMIDNTLPGKGEVTGSAGGIARLFASCGGKDSETISFTVGDPAVVTRVEFDHDNPLNFSAKGEERDDIQLRVVVTLDTGEQESAPEEFVWTATGDTGRIFVSNDAGSRGKLTIRPNAVGTITVTAEYDGNRYDENRSVLTKVTLKIVVE